MLVLEGRSASDLRAKIARNAICVARRLISAWIEA